MPLKFPPGVSIRYHLTPQVLLIREMVEKFLFQSVQLSKGLSHGDVICPSPNGSQGRPSRAAANSGAQDPPNNQLQINKVSNAIFTRPHVQTCHGRGI